MGRNYLVLSLCFYSIIVSLACYKQKYRTFRVSINEGEHMKISKAFPMFSTKNK